MRADVGGVVISYDSVCISRGLHSGEHAVVPILRMEPHCIRRRNGCLFSGQTIFIDPFACDVLSPRLAIHGRAQVPLPQQVGRKCYLVHRVPAGHMGAIYSLDSDLLCRPS